MEPRLSANKLLPKADGYSNPLLHCQPFSNLLVNRNGHIIRNLERYGEAIPNPTIEITRTSSTIDSKFGKISVVYNHRAPGFKHFVLNRATPYHVMPSP